MITGSLETISPSILALMGISAGTALGDTMIDANKHESETSSRRSLLAEKKTIQTALAEVETQVTGAAVATPITNPGPGTAASTPTDSIKTKQMELRIRLEEVDSSLRDLEPSENEQVSQGFLHDLLTDGQGYSFHRFQIFAWTIVLGIIFISSVYEGLHMPEFSSTLLGLMGLSAGTYVSLKFPEK